MKNHLLIQTLKTLSLSELQSFAQYVSSPYFNSDRRPLLLLHRLMDYAPEYKVQKKKLFKSLFPDRSYHAKQVKKEIDNLYRLLLGFLTQEELKADPNLADRLLLKRQYKRGLAGEAEINWHNAKAGLIQNRKLSADYYHNQFMLAEEFDVSHRSSSFFERKTLHQQKVEYLDAFYLISRLKAFCHFKFSTQQALYPEEIACWDHLLSFFHSHNTATFQSPVVKIYRELLEILQGGSVEAPISKAIELLTHYHEVLSLEESKQMLSYLQDTCEAHLEVSPTTIKPLLLSLHKLRLMTGIWDERLAPRHEQYTDSLRLGLELEAYDWCDRLLQRFPALLSPKMEDDAFRFGLASTKSAMQEWEAAVQIIEKEPFQSLFFKLKSKQLLLNIFYEQGEWQKARSLVNVFYRMLHTHTEISIQEKEAYSQYLRMLKKLINLSEQKHKMDLATFQAKCLRLHGLLKGALGGRREWLQRKVESLQTSFS